MFIVTNRLEMSAEQQQKMIMAFRKSMPTLQQFKGFQSFETWISDDGSYMLAVSHWESRAAYDNYVNSETFRKHHGGASSEEMQPHANITYYAGETLG
ncbi:antibiotic biosynthesis monooxygenase family protein [Dictyobacter arantiisoli]|uniref:Heme oxygenase (Staphylobilin-producing) n=1 Tax=Dictyobacter arantiisoli TaxID=2014874 RepID=A0A5A5TI64_9CHLR|nr:antibiotic biosynthesis monooxygenase [Dictyobacter arantiisoli]GCF10753.1 heme oxygenase (staphylobilin-producing) [Dictyobacter arantiisoli]